MIKIYKRNFQEQDRILVEKISFSDVKSIVKQGDVIYVYLSDTYRTFLDYEITIDFALQEDLK